MACKQVFSISTLLLLLSVLPVVRGKYSVELAGLVCAGVSAFFLLIIVGVVIGLALTWKNWFPALQMSRNKVKMPRSYWKKKREMKKRLLDGSRMTSSTVVPPMENGMVNGDMTEISRVRDTEINKASWVEGWNITDHPENTAYEELSLAMDLTEEKDEPEFRIETTVEDSTNFTTTRTTDHLGRPYTALTVVRDNANATSMDIRPLESVKRTDSRKQAPVPYTSTRTQTGHDPSEFRIVAAVVDNEALDLGPFKTMETQTAGGAGAKERGGGGGGGEGTSEQTVTMTMGDDEPAWHITSYSDFLDSSRVAF